jgi:hypothetical protein
VTPTQLSLRHLRANGYLAEVVERWNAHTQTRHDLFQIADILAVRPGETLAVQTTTAPNVAARVRKIADNPNIGAIREAGWSVVVHGWRQNKNRRWELHKEVDCS